MLTFQRSGAILLMAVKGPRSLKQKLSFMSHDERGERMRLGDVATVRSGLVLSRKQAKGPSSVRYMLLNLRSINPGGYIDTDEMDVFDAQQQLSPEYLSQRGDIVVRLTAPYTAVLIDEETEGIVVSSNFLIIRTDPKQLLPAYLFWLLNTSSVKRDIYENTSSNMLGAVKAGFFTDFEFTLLSLDKQQKIADMNTAAIKEKLLLRQLAEAKAKYYELMIDSIHNEMKRGN